MEDVATDSLAWSFVKLLGRHLSCKLHEFQGLPASHAWPWKAAGLWHARLLTKAQCIGVIVSIVERAERVEFLIDDGTALIKAALWGEFVHAPVSLGDLVHVKGKLNVAKNWESTESPLTPARELRVLRINKIEDPNEELLHWAQAMELTETYYSASRQHNVQTKSDSAEEVKWEAIATQVFFDLRICPSAKQKYLRTVARDSSDDVLLETLENILLQQKQNTAKPLSVTFGEHLIVTNRGSGGTIKNKTIRSLQYAFRKLRCTGLLVLEDDMSDRYQFQSFEVSLKPALLQLVRDQSDRGGVSIAAIADEILRQQRFQWIPLQWIEIGLGHLLVSNLAIQREESQLVFIA